MPKRKLSVSDDSRESTSLSVVENESNNTVEKDNDETSAKTMEMEAVLEAAREAEKQERKARAMKSIDKLLNVSEKYAQLWRQRFEVIQISTDRKSKNFKDNITAPKILVDNEDFTNMKYFTGELRPYQIEGVSWMKTLYMGGMNGILADEMGLGKTVQIIALIAHFLEQGVVGPHLVVAPLSTIPNWTSEFARFAPQIPVVTFHGNAERRSRLKKDINKSYPVGKMKTKPIVLVAYHNAQNEVDFLRSMGFRYVIIDEAQRIKNHKSMLAVAMRKIPCSNKVLLTGTPLQNNMTELWALLNYIMPQIFKKLDAFSELLVLEDMENKNIRDDAVENETIISKIHKVLAPFMLRRLKKDVLGDLVPKKEAIVYCPMTDLQRSIYSHIIKKSADLIMGRSEESVEVEVIGSRTKRLCTMKPKDFYVDPLKYMPVQVRPLKDVKQEVDWESDIGNLFKIADMTRDEINEKNSVESSNGTYDDVAASKSKKDAAKIVTCIDSDIEEISSDDEDLSDEEFERKIAKEQLSYERKKEELKRLREVEEQRRLDNRRKVFGARGGIHPEYYYNIKFQNPAMMYRKVVDHPYLISMPIIPGTREILFDETFVTQSGKMLVLDAMLNKLKEQGHKVLIFSTLKIMLDIIEDYMLMRNFDYCRLDGDSTMEMRGHDIDRFNNDEGVLAFLVSTRAGGLGINLTSADTVIMFDRDWNPQVDIQAQARCHRIGQTKPVMIFSLVTKNTIDEKVLRCGEMKMRLEKLIIKNGVFKNSALRHADDSERLAEYMELLKMLDNDTRHVIHPNGYVFSEEELDALLDRTELYKELERSKEANQAKS